MAKVEYSFKWLLPFFGQFSPNRLAPQNETKEYNLCLNSNFGPQSHASASITWFVWWMIFSGAAFGPKSEEKGLSSIRFLSFWNMSIHTCNAFYKLPLDIFPVTLQANLMETITMTKSTKSLDKQNYVNFLFLLLFLQHVCKSNLKPKKQLVCIVLMDHIFGLKPLKVSVICLVNSNKLHEACR